MSRGAAIRFELASVRYDDTDRDAIADVTLDVVPGELLVLLGPSGCGKSTLLRTVNRLVPLTRGRIAIDDTDVTALDPVALRRAIGYAIQAVGLFSHMSVAQNIAIVPSLLGWPRDRIAARVDELLALVRLEPQRYRHRRPRDLSGGEAQRVGVARAIAAQPRALLMDEPFGAVDAIVRAQLQRELVRIVRELGTTTLFVTHDVEEALHLADRIVVMKDGRLEQIATPLQMLVTPANAYVAELIGAGDVIRRLTMLRARDAVQRSTVAVDGVRIDAHADLHTVLNVLLGGAERVVVVEAEHPIGTIDFAAVRATIMGNR